MTTARFKPIWRCWSCGDKLQDGQRLDCPKCERMLEDARKANQGRLAAALAEHDRATGVDWTSPNPPRITSAERIRYAESNGVIETLRRELAGIIV